MKTEKRLLPLICAAVFLLVTAGLRFFNIFIASATADVTYSDSFVRTLDTVHDILVLGAYGFSAAVVVYTCKKWCRTLSLKAAALMSGVVLADRVFCFVYDVATSNINIREEGTVSTAITWLLVDFLFFAAMYFAGAFLTSVIERKSMEAAEKDNSFPLFSIGATVGVMTVLQLASQIVICVQFFMEYDDVTATEKAQMLGDILWILVEYGGILAAFAMIFYALLSFVHGNIIKNKENG